MLATNGAKKRKSFYEENDFHKLNFFQKIELKGSNLPSPFVGSQIKQENVRGIPRNFLIERSENKFLS